MLNKPVRNECYTVEITDYTAEGAGVGRITWDEPDTEMPERGFPLFIKDAAIGDLCQVRVTKVKGSYGYGHIEQILHPSPHRITPVCQEARRCGGCQLQHITYAAELSFKERKVRNNLIRIGGFSAGQIDETGEGICGMETDRGEVPMRYRNKAQVPVGRTQEGEVTCGFYAGHSHRIIPMEDCLLSPAEYGQILQIVCNHCTAYHIPPYDEMTGKGLLRHVLIRKGFATGELMVCLVVNQTAGDTPEERGGGARRSIPVMEKLPLLIAALTEIPGMTGICINYNPNRTNVILGEVTEAVWGSGVIRDRLCGRVFCIGPRAFYQVNPVQTEALYAQAAVCAGVGGMDGHHITLWDVYCGIGTIGQTMAEQVGRVIGIEIIPEAVENARENAAANHLTNTEYHVGRAEEVLPRLVRSRMSKPADPEREDVVIVDPPRKGCDEACLAAILELAPERIVYISCDSATLARDLRTLVEGGYELRHWRAYDLFPRTVHVETVCLLSKGDVKSKKIRVEFSLEDMDADGFKQGATYNAIRDWIKEKYGYRVTNLNIAQVKQKYGIIERENYNKPKSSGSKQPGCPEEKIKAIENAMRHFQMI